MSIRSRLNALCSKAKDFVSLKLYPAWCHSLKPLLIMLGFTTAGLMLIETSFVIWLTSQDFPFDKLPDIPSSVGWLVSIGGLYLAIRCFDKAYDL